jgi:outer membrane protein
MWIRALFVSSALAFLLAQPALASDALFERARGLIAAGNPKQAFTELAANEARLAGNEVFDSLLGVAALDSNRPDDAIIAFERVLSVNPGNAGAQLDLARAYFATGAFDLAETALQRLQMANPPAAARVAIERYLEAIRQRRLQTRPGVAGYLELSLGRDSNLTGVPRDFTGAVFSAFQIPDVLPTGNSIRRADAYVGTQGALEYGHPVARGFGVYASVDARTRTYRDERDFNLNEGSLRIGATQAAGESQWRGYVSAQRLRQDGAAPGVDTATTTNDRNTTAATLDWRRALNARSQIGVTAQVARVAFPTNDTEDFNQALVAVSYLAALTGERAPLLYLNAFVTDDRARRNLADGVTDKSKRVIGLRGYGQLGVIGNLQGFGQIGASWRLDQSDFARANTVQRGRDVLGEASVGILWRFMPQCQARSQIALSRNDSNIAIYDYNRTELSTSVRCDLR